MKKFYLAAILILVALAYWQGWPPFPHRGDRSAAPTTTVAQRGTIAPVLPLSGEVTPAFQVEVKPEIGGKIKTIHVSAGSRVAKGDPLVTIDDTDLLNERAGSEAEIEGARLVLEKARGNYERARQLHEQRLLSNEEFFNLEADFKIAKNELERALRRLQLVDDRLSKTRILAPSDGTVLQVLVSEGQVVVGAASVNSGTSLVNLADLSRLLVTTHVNQLDADKVRPGTKVRIGAADGNGHAAEGEIAFVAPLATVENDIKGFEANAVITTEEHGLKPGVSVGMEVPLGSAGDVVTLPVTAVFEENGEEVVFVLEDGKPVRRSIRTGLIESSRVEIVSGVDEGEEVLTMRPPETSGGRS